MVNGGDGNDIFVNGPAIQPSPDAIEEFRVLTNTFDAEYGRNSGSVVNVVAKSGSNSVHGDFYEFFRNKVLNTKGFFDSTVPDYKQISLAGRWVIRFRRIRLVGRRAPILGRASFHRGLAAGGFCGSVLRRGPHHQRAPVSVSCGVAAGSGISPSPVWCGDRSGAPAAFCPRAGRLHLHHRQPESTSPAGSPAVDHSQSRRSPQEADRLGNADGVGQLNQRPPCPSTRYDLFGQKTCHVGCGAIYF